MPKPWPHPLDPEEDHPLAVGAIIIAGAAIALLAIVTLVAG